MQEPLTKYFLLLGRSRSAAIGDQGADHAVLARVDEDFTVAAAANVQVSALDLRSHGGASTAANCAILRPDMFRAVVQLSVPYTARVKDAPEPSEANRWRVGVTPPINADGRILAEALVSPPANVAPRQQKIKELDFTLLDVEKAIEKLKAAQSAGAGGRGRGAPNPVADAERDYYKIERILEWNKFGTYDRLIDHHKRLVARINASLK